MSLKRELLRRLLREQVPDEKHPFRNTLELSDVVSVIKTHRLLAGPVDEKQLESWNSTVDAWVNRLLTLVSNNMPDKQWAGICLLGVTCQECSSDRFLVSYSIWFDKLLPHIQTPTSTPLVKVAACAAISDLFTRLGNFPNAKKDGNSQASKLIQPLLKLLNDDSSIVWEKALCLLCTILNVFPSSLWRHYDSAEAAIVSKIMSEKCSIDILKKLGHVLALLPKSKGDEETWSLMMRKILFSMNVHLNNAFQGLEEESRSKEVTRMLLPPGQDPPPPLGGEKMLEEASNMAAKRPEQLLMSSVTMLMHCCCTMLSSSYPVQVTVPVRLLVAIAGRVLLVDGSLSSASFPDINILSRVFICSKIPFFHSCSLEILTAIVKGLRSQLLPHAADIVRILSEYFGRCSIPELRIKVYSIIKYLLLSMGVGIAICLKDVVINNAFIDLDSTDHGSGGTDHGSGGTQSNVFSSETLLQFSQRKNRKRKHAGTTRPLQEQSDGIALEVESYQSVVPISLKIAALETLEALLNVGGALRSESRRSCIDQLIFTVAMNACKGGWAREEKNIFVSGEPTPSWADFQLAALRALLASLLSPVCLRPPYLSQGLHLFRTGMQETGTKLSEFCAHALLALEVLIHPRALPLGDYRSSSTDNQRNVQSMINDHDDDDDELFRTYQSDAEIENLVAKQPLETLIDPSAQSLPAEEVDHGLIQQNEDENSVEKQEQPVMNPIEEHVSLAGNSVDIAMDDSEEKEKQKGNTKFLDLDNRNMFQFELDNEDEDDEDSIPDIVDVEPDSDSD